MFTVLLSLTAIGQDWKNLVAKMDSTSGKFGFVDSTNQFVIQPKFDQVRDFVSEYTSVRIDTLWGIINTNGAYKIRPKFKSISIVYRDHFIEYGKNMKFRSINGEVIYEYFYIPGPFSQMKDFKDDPEVKQIPDYELIVRVSQMYGDRKPCHYIDQFRPLNFIAIETKKYGKMTIDFVLDNPEEVLAWIKKDKEFEAAFERGEINCCGYGPW